MNHLLPLLVAVPLLGAIVPFVLGARYPRLAVRATAAVLLAQVGIAVAVVAAVAASGPQTYVLGGLPAAVGIGLLVDQVSGIFVVLVAVAGAVLYLTVREDATGPGDSLWLLLVAGLTGVVVTADVFNLYVFLEISGLAAYGLVASRRGGTAALAALHYLLVGTVGATFYLLGVGYAYVATGTLAMADLQPALASVGYDSPLVLTSFVFVTLGLAVKLALFPVHAWKPDAYAGSAHDVAALLATLGSTVAGYALVRVVFGVFTAEFLAAVPLVQTALLAAGVVSVAAGGYLTLRQSNLRRLLSYSSILQFGLVLVGLSLATAAAVTGALVLLVGNAVAKGGLFVATGLFERELEAVTVADLAGKAREAPVTAAAVALAFTSLVGLPPTAGFAGKWYVTLAAVDSGRWVVATVVVLSTLVSLAYAGRVVERLYLADGDGEAGAGHAVADGGQPADARFVPGLESRAVAVVVLAALATLVLGLGSTALADWVAPVVEVWL
ncbi:complex I subunit 5 family protein [Haloarchaeobius amylolyticus]|uniref:complex I subunit 5 family protein n=1 Tax=Haloarchaeobius amylolyticus TaxID=1198296 RepID=UPI00226D9F5C|nr:proton-conducting transporter membrane subunit [Haloarchaeobius amylolyticus]